MVSLALEVLQFVLDLLKHRNILTVCVITRSNEVKFQSQKFGYTQTSDLHIITGDIVDDIGFMEDN